MADYAFRTLEDRQKIEKLWEDGRTPKEISASMDKSLAAIYACPGARTGPACRISACGIARNWPNCGCSNRWRNGASGPGNPPTAAR